MDIEIVISQVSNTLRKIISASADDYCVELAVKLTHPDAYNQ